jgi:hypothetical protein
MEHPVCHTADPGRAGQGHGSWGRAAERGPVLCRALALKRRAASACVPGGDCTCLQHGEGDTGGRPARAGGRRQATQHTVCVVHARCMRACFPMEPGPRSLHAPPGPIAARARPERRPAGLRTCPGGARARACGRMSGFRCAWRSAAAPGGRSDCRSSGHFGQRARWWRKEVFRVLRNFGWNSCLVPPSS